MSFFFVKHSPRFRFGLCANADGDNGKNANEKQDSAQYFHRCFHFYPQFLHPLSRAKTPKSGRLKFGSVASQFEKQAVKFIAVP